MLFQPYCFVSVGYGKWMICEHSPALENLEFWLGNKIEKVSLLALFNLCDLNSGITQMTKQQAALSKPALVPMALAGPIQRPVLNFPYWVWKSKGTANVGARHWLWGTMKGKMIPMVNKWRHEDISEHVKTTLRQALWSRQRGWLTLCPRELAVPCLWWPTAAVPWKSTAWDDDDGPEMGCLDEKISGGNYTLWKSGEIQPSVHHFGDRGHREAAWWDVCCQLSKWAQKADFSACLRFTPRPIPSNQNESALSTGTNLLWGSQYSPLHTHLS